MSFLGMPTCVAIHKYQEKKRERERDGERARGGERGREERSEREGGERREIEVECFFWFNSSDDTPQSE